MKTLIVDDDFMNRRLMQEFLGSYGETHIAINGVEAVEAVRVSLKENAPYDLICLDIIMPKMDGQEALQKIRTLEEENGIWSTRGSKIIMTTAMADMKNIAKAYGSLCDLYITRPIIKGNLIAELQKLKLIE